MITAALGEASGPADPRVNAAWQAIADTGALTPLLGMLRTHLRVGGLRLAIKPVGMLEAREDVRNSLTAFTDAVRAHLDETTR